MIWPSSNSACGTKAEIPNGTAWWRMAGGYPALEDIADFLCRNVDEVRAKTADSRDCARSVVKKPNTELPVWEVSRIKGTLAAR